LKYNKPALSTEQQLELLRHRGMAAKADLQHAGDVGLRNALLPWS
jgi:hypothetical protein